MYNVLRRLALLTLLVATVVAKIPCWGINYQPEVPAKLR